MNFTPKTAAQIAEENLFQEGEYDFEILHAENKTSKAGNEMIQIELKVYAPSGRTQFVRDYLMEKMMGKLLNFCECVGLSDKYEQGTLEPHDCEGKTGRLKLIIKKDKDKVYPDQNSVADYICKKSPAAEPESDDIPF